jgi:hypothetical protein
VWKVAGVEAPDRGGEIEPLSGLRVAGVTVPDGESACGDHAGNVVLALSLGTQRTCSFRTDCADGAVVRVWVD